eukprot:1169962-Prorocentrum_minimum.AAC.2
MLGRGRLYKASGKGPKGVYSHLLGGERRLSIIVDQCSTSTRHKRGFRLVEGVMSTSKVDC